MLPRVERALFACPSGRCCFGRAGTPGEENCDQAEECECNQVHLHCPSKTDCPSRLDVLDPAFCGKESNWNFDETDGVAECEVEIDDQSEFCFLPFRRRQPVSCGVREQHDDDHPAADRSDHQARSHAGGIAKIRPVRNGFGPGKNRPRCSHVRAAMIGEFMKRRLEGKGRWWNHDCERSARRSGSRKQIGSHRPAN